MTSSSSRAELIRERLENAFSPVELVIEDESSRHAGHHGHTGQGETHFAVSLTSEKFNGLNRLGQQRLVQEVLQDLFAQGLHALSLKTHAVEGK